MGCSRTDHAESRDQPLRRHRTQTNAEPGAGGLISTCAIAILWMSDSAGSLSRLWRHTTPTALPRTLPFSKPHSCSITTVQLPHTVVLLQTSAKPEKEPYNG